MDRKLYQECEIEFGKIADLLSPLAHKKGPINDAFIRAWRMMMKMEELRNRHPY